MALCCVLQRQQIRTWLDLSLLAHPSKHSKCISSFAFILRMDFSNNCHIWFAIRLRDAFDVFREKQLCTVRYLPSQALLYVTLHSIRYMQVLISGINCIQSKKPWLAKDSIVCIDRSFIETILSWWFISYCDEQKIGVMILKLSISPFQLARGRAFFSAIFRYSWCPNLGSGPRCGTNG